jgi:hypothetical protein
MGEAGSKKGAMRDWIAGHRAECVVVFSVRSVVRHGPVAGHTRHSGPPESVAEIQNCRVGILSQDSAKHVRLRRARL